MSLAGKVAVVTGGAMGIGRACALRLAQDGADVALLDIAEKELASSAQEIREKTGRKVLALKTDLLDRSAISESFAQIRAEMGPVYVLNNVAGQSARERAAPFWDSKPEVWDFIHNLNLRAAGDCTREVVNDMREQKGGRIIFISSECAWNSPVGLADYAAAKAGLIGLTRALAGELAPYKITVNAVCPGVIRSRAQSQIPKDVMDSMLNAIPLGEIGEPEVVAHAVSYYASPLASYTTGSYLLVTGGRTIA